LKVPKSKVLKIVLPITFFIGAIGIFAGLVQSRPVPQQVVVEPPTLLVTVETANLEDVTFEVESQGSVVPRTQTTLMSEVSGQIVEVSPSFVSGGFFKKGDVLIRIDSRKYETALKRARANVAKAETSVATEKALSGYALDDWKKLQRLQGSKGRASDLALRKPQLQEAMAELTSMEASQEEALEDMNRTVIRAPYDGMVREKIADVGQFVNVGAQLALTFAVDYAEVRLPISQSDLRYLDLERIDDQKQALPVRLTTVVNGDESTWSANVVRSEGVFDPNSRVMYVVAQISDPYDIMATGKDKLRIGSFVRARIEGVAGGGLFRIPRHALYRGTTIWIVDDESRIQPRELSIVRTDDVFAYANGGIDDGDLFCITPIDQPLPGTLVRYDG
jgi:RND family efflux transporter MFP subunit